MTSCNASRRNFLRRAGAFSALGAAGPTALNLAALGTAAAATASDYKALVCVFLFGGNDPFNTVLATDSSSWASYTALRKQAPESIALLAPGTAVNTGAAAASPARLGGVLKISPLNPRGRTYALHPVLGSMRSMFDTDRRLAIVANVGPLVVPTTKAQYASLTHPKPAKLFSHNDQQSVWQAFAPEGAGQGWGGRMGDIFASANGGSQFAAVSAGGNAVWLTGEDTRGYQIGPAGAIRYPVDLNGVLYNSREVDAALVRIPKQNYDGHVLKADLASAASHSMSAEEALRTVLKPASDAMWGTPATNYSQTSDPKLQYTSPLTGAAAPNPLAAQLQVVARMIDASGTLGLRRQVFFVGLGGFDTHKNQNASHADLLAQLADAMGYFDGVLAGMGLRNKVTTFTASDFGRSFTSNGDGTDHGWGGHQFVMGGAVKGGDIYGTFPVLGAKNAGNNYFDSSPNQLLNGVLLPTTSVDQFGATLARWFGVSDAQLVDVFPNLANFDVSTRNLGFMV